MVWTGLQLPVRHKPTALDPDAWSFSGIKCPGNMCVFVRMLPYPLLFRLQVVALMRNVPMLWLKVPL